MSIFNGWACIGVSSLFKIIGVRFTVGNKGEPLFVKSTESRFLVLVAFGVSQFYPRLFGKFSHTSRYLSTGLLSWTVNFSDLVVAYVCQNLWTLPSLRSKKQA